MEKLFSFLSFLSSTHSISFDATSETLNSTDTVNDTDFDNHIDNTSENTTNASSVSSSENSYKGRLLYIENFAKPTETCSSLAGKHLSQRNVPVFTIRHKKPIILWIQILKLHYLKRDMLNFAANHEILRLRKIFNVLIRVD